VLPGYEEIENACAISKFWFVFPRAIGFYALDVLSESCCLCCCGCKEKYADLLIASAEGRLND